MAYVNAIQIGINPGLTAAHVGHHYAGPGNHFCKYCTTAFIKMYVYLLVCLDVQMPNIC